MTTLAARDLHELHALRQWLHDPARRLTWHTTRLARQTDAAEQERRTRRCEQPNTGASAEQTVRSRQHLADTQARADLTVLGEQFTEAARLRLTVTLADCLQDRQESEPGKGLREQLAEDIADEIRTIAEDLLETQPVYPGEAHRNAEAVLTPLLRRDTALTATSGSEDLTRWLADLRAARLVLDQAATTA
ncbi:hypothetical protein [Streptomyces sp. NRRL B-24484]|uniref:hypothetical protein n=1 Tax=Streptomyces sp. NRRL B-24484 TaxID=1463833 RepID=UPI0004C1D466|nr:hypothetical protein [Streptomyces sp. NRRL B-24484]